MDHKGTFNNNIINNEHGGSKILVHELYCSLLIGFMKLSCHNIRTSAVRREKGICLWHFDSLYSPRAPRGWNLIHPTAQVHM